MEPELRNILEVVGDLSHYNISTNVLDTSVVQYSGGLSSVEVYHRLDELESLGLVKMLKPVSDLKEKDGEAFRLINITKEGLEELLPNRQKSR